MEKVPSAPGPAWNRPWCATEHRVDWAAHSLRRDVPTSYTSTSKVPSTIGIYRLLPFYDSSVTIFWPTLDSVANCKKGGIVIYTALVIIISILSAMWGN
jgi:hypothetical protein